MATVMNPWGFPTDDQGLVDEGNSSNISVAYDGSDGSPATGCLKFSCGAVTLTTESELARRSSTGQTWVDFGVPSGSTVTDVQITAWVGKSRALILGETFTVKMRIVGSGGSTVHSAGDLLNSSVGGLGSWTAGSAGTSRAVDSASQASSTDVRLEIEVVLTTNGSLATDVRLDAIELTITYTPPVSRVRPYLIARQPAGLVRGRARVFPIPSINGPANQRIAAAPFSDADNFPIPVVRSAQSVQVFAFTEAEHFPAVGTLATISVQVTVFTEGDNFPGLTVINNPGNASVRPAAFTDVEQFPAATAQPSGNLKFKQCRDMAGAVWTAEVAVANADSGAAGVFLGDGYGVLYGSGGAVYWKATQNPLDWS